MEKSGFHFIIKGFVLTVVCLVKRNTCLCTVVEKQRKEHGTLFIRYVKIEKIKWNFDLGMTLTWFYIVLVFVALSIKPKDAVLL